MPLTIVVLAAGQGRRMRSQQPKVLQTLAGRPMLAHVLETARALMPDAVHVVHGHGAEAVRGAFGDSDVRWCLQAEQLGTGHAVAQALPNVPDGHRVLVLCGDVPLVTPDTLAPLVEASDGLALLTADVADAAGYGRIVRGADGRVCAIVEHGDATPDQLRITEINTGLLSAPSAALRRWLARLGTDNVQGEYYLTDVIGFALADGVPVAGIAAADAADVLGVNDRRQLADAERRLQRRMANALLDAGATLADPERVDIRGRVDVGHDVRIDVGAVFEGDVSLGDSASIGPYCVIRNARIGPGTRVHAHSVIDGAETGTGCEIGPYARIRPDTSLADGVKVGNFVELKASRVAPGSQINHLSYVGDTSVGRDVNIGAGTITCNYDGAAKHRTVIGDGAFIGSGAMLVAPVEVGAGATIGAGSTITKTAPAGELTVARVRQTTVTGWRRPVKRPK